MSAHGFAFHRMGKAVVLAAAGMLGINLLPHLNPKLTVNTFQLESVQAPEELQEHVRNIARSMNLPNPERISVFIASGLRSMSSGHTTLPRGAAIGLPRTVLYQDAKDVVDSGLNYLGEAVDWDSDIGKAIQKSALPAKDEINFVIAHEVAHLKHKDYIFFSLLSPITLILTYITARIVPLAMFPVQYGPVVSGGILISGIVIFVYFKGLLGRRQEFGADKAAASTHPSYRKGGIRYMEKKLLLEAHINPTGPSRLRTDTLFAGSHPPFQDRLQNILELEELNNNYIK